MKSKLLASLLIVMAMLCVFAFGASAATVTISTAEEFLTLMNEGYTMSDTFELANDIDLSTTTGQTPIGTASKKFTGTFDGKGFTVSGINITSSTDTSYPYVGLFGLCQKATIKNVTVRGNVTAPSNDSKDVYAGGLVAWTRGIAIDNCHSYITVVNNDNGSCAGGILGYADFNGTDISVNITNSTNHGNVTAEQYTGGILGLVQSVNKANQILTITGCDNYGDITITAGNCVGGIVGYYRCGSTDTTGSKFTLSDCGNYGTVENKATASSKGGYTGGIVGAVLASGTNGTYHASITLTNLYNAGSVKRAISASIGAIVGYLTLPVVNDGTVDVTMSDWVNVSTAPSWLIYSIGNAGTPVSMEMTNIVNNTSTKVFSEEKDLSAAITINTNNTVTVDGYVTSASTAAEKKAFAAASSDAYYIDNGNVTFKSLLELDTEISSAEELQLLMQVRGDAATLDKDYKLMCDIDMTGYDQQPIGISGANNRFTGSFDGQDYTISGLNISYNSQGTGLFGTVDGATIKNLNVKGTVSGTGTNGSRVGGIIGQAMGNVTVSNCNVEVTLSANSGASAGILGTHTGASAGTVTITGCTVNGSLSGSQYMGGILGYVLGSSAVKVVITDCTNNASVTTTSSNVAGGILGYYANTNTSGDNTIEISSCKNTGTISTKGTYPGGIVGAIGGGSADSCHISEITLTNLHNEGEVLGTSGRGDIVSAIRPANGTVCTITDVYGGSPSTIPVINTINADVEGNTKSTYTVTRAYGEGNVKVVYNDNAENITLVDCHGLINSQTATRDLYELTANSDAWVMTYDGPRLATFADSAKVVDYSIDSAEDLVNLMNAPRAWGGGDFTLTMSISLSGKTQSPIGISGNFKFMANFDGKNYTISGVNIDYAQQGAGLFGTVQYGSIKNLTVKGTVNGGNSRVGGLVGAVRAPFTIENVTTEVNVTSTYGATGGIVGAYACYDRNQEFVITGCTSKSTVNGTSYNGGILGYMFTGADVPQTLTITNCTNSGTVTGTGGASGGIIGATSAPTGSTITVTGCTNTGAITGTRYNGGIYGYITTDTNTTTVTECENVTYTIKDCTNTGAVTSNGGENYNGTAGMVGMVTLASGASLTVDGCTNEGKISGPSYNGGIVGFVSNLTSGEEVNGASYKITGCINEGDIETTIGNVAGGILGIYSNAAPGTTNNTLIVEKSANYGGISVAGGEYAGGVIGCIGGGSNGICRADVTLSQLYSATENIVADYYRATVVGALRTLASGSYTISDLCGEGIDYAVICTIGDEDLDPQEFTITRAFSVDNADIVADKAGNTITTSNCCTSESPASYLVRLSENKNWVMTLGGPRLALFTDESEVVTSPYTINTADDLITVMNNSAIWSFDFILAKDINLSGKTQSPIGTSERKFTGTFDGQGNTISGIDITYGQNAGLFGAVQGSSADHCIIKNLNVDGKVTCTNSRAGGIVGTVAGGGVEIIGCTSDVDITATQGAGVGAAGGIIGTVQLSDYGANIKLTTLIENCTNTGTITGSRYNGGIMGYVVGNVAGSEITITKCMNYGDVNNTSANCAGGILGYYHLEGEAGDSTTTDTSTLTITHCGNYGDITGLATSQFVGGIIGAIPSHETDKYVVDFTLTDVYNCGTITGRAGNSGSITGLVGALADGSYTFNNWGDEGSAAIPMLGDISTSALAPTYAITNAYTVNGTVLPDALDGNTINTTLGLNAASAATDKTTLAAQEGWVMTKDGPMLEEFTTAEDFEVDYSIDSVEDYLIIVGNPSSWNGDFTLETDIDVGGLATTPIGNSVTAFTGTFDGKGNTISGLNIKGTEAGTGFFGVVSDDGDTTVIKNLTIEGAVCCDEHRFVGGFVGIVCGETELLGLVNKATVTSNYFGPNAGRIGGIVGGFVNNNLVPAINDVDNDGDFGLTIKNCANYGKVEGKLNTSYEYSDEYNTTPTVFVRHSQARVGGIIGSITPAYASASNKGSNNILIENCQNYGEVTGIVAVGGIAGVAESSKATNNIKITKCSNYGEVSSVYAGGSDVWFGTWTGGIVGYANLGDFDAQYVDSFEISYCYNEGEISAPNAYLIDSRLAQEFIDEDDVVTDGEGVEDGDGDDATTSSIEYRAQIGGIVGYAYGGYEDHVVTIKSCFNNGFVWANGNDVAGIVGISNSAHVYDCYNLGRVESTFIDTKTETRSYGRYVGGIIGRIAGTLNDFERNFNKGEVVSTGGSGMFGVGGGYNAYPDFYANNFYYNSLTTKDKNSTKVTEAQLGDYSVFTGINESSEWLYTLYGPELVYFHECENTEDIVTLETTCITTGLYNETCRCLETVYAENVVLPIDENNHAFEKSVWAETAEGTYEFKCKDCQLVKATAEEPFVYVDAYNFINAFVGDDENDGVTPETAVYTIEEAVRRLATTGGKVIICDRYYLGNNGALEVNLPAYEKTITFTTRLADAGNVNTGFAVIVNGVHFNLGGPTKFENIIFNGSSDTKNISDNGYYKIPVICAGWNDLEFGNGIYAYGAAYVIAGNCYHDEFKVASASNDAEKTQNLVFGKVTAFDIKDASGEKLQNAVTFFSRVYLGDRVREGAVDNVASYTVANKTVNATFNNSTVVDMYVAAAISPESINAQMSGINTTVNINDAAYVRYIHTGDGNTDANGNGTAYMDKLTVNVNDSARVYGAWAFENIRDLTLNISAEDERAESFEIAARPLVTVSQGYVPTGNEKVSITYGSHSFKKGVAAPSVNAVYDGKTVVTVKDDCDWSEAELDIVECVYVETCSYCGAVKKTPAGTSSEFESDDYQYGISAALTSELVVEYLVKIDKNIKLDDIKLEIAHYAFGAEKPEVTVVAPHKITEGNLMYTYRFYAPGVAAKEMNDRIDITVHALDKDGNIFHGATVSKNIITYYEMAYETLNGNTTGQAPALMNTLNALLNYGAEAQRYFGYNTGALANSVLPAEEQKTEFTTEASATTSVANDCANDVYTVDNYAPILEDRIVMAVAFNLVGDAVSDLSFKAGYTDINGNNKTFEIGGEKIIVNETQVLVYVDAISAKDLRQMVTGALYSGDTQVSDSISFSFECYAVKASASEENICAAILNYCDAARELFKKPAVTE